MSRASLIHSGRAGDHRVVAVTAPAGYGKSTLLAEWAHVEDRPIAWVSLDTFDDDPAALLFTLAAAYERASSDRELTADMRGYRRLRPWTSGTSTRCRIRIRTRAVRPDAG